MPLHRPTRRMTATSTLAAAGIVLLALSGCSAPAPAPAASATPLSGDEVAAYVASQPTIPEIQKKLDDGSLTSAQLVDAYLARIDEYDKKGPALNAMISLNADARQTAADRDAQRHDGTAHGPLYCIPVILKDNIDTSDEPTTIGSVVFKDATPAKDAFVVKELRDAGAIILGKSNLQEYAYGFATISSLGGQTLNPYDLTKNPSGSSGGSAVAMAAGYAPLAFGTDTGGSIRVPASATSTFGIRPTKGLIGRSGIAPVSTTWDTVGPMAASVTDLAVALDVVTAGPDPDDALSAHTKVTKPASYLAGLDANSLKGAHIVVMDENTGTTDASTDVNTAMAQVEKNLVSAGAQVTHLSSLGFASTAGPQNQWETEPAFNDYLTTYRTELPGLTFAQIAANTAVTPDVHASLSGLVGSVGTSDPSYAAQVTGPAADFAAKFADYMAANRVDAFLYPSSKEPPSALGVSNWSAVNAFLAPSAGAPAISFPAGYTSGGLPVGAELLGAPFSEEKLLSLAYAYSTAFPTRVHPSTTP